MGLLKPEVSEGVFEGVSRTFDLERRIFRKRWLLEACQLSEQIIGCLLAMVVDAMSGMVPRCARHGEMR
ncbi:hypothetical protein [Streptomyces gobiensis]|uniref:hypothetical protein n=1 Tax=Streptomyces gobiensis TaxID=2875706 RepID=UPI001E648B15|nr:hypothetical protein [Streptomyces gobiensis]UGY93319.1 hypothetical protein test1122_17420 [Streptomyces gobiensis]